jgi:hypothetical protein
MRSDVARVRAGRRLGASGLILAFAVAVAGCGGGGNAGSTTSRGGDAAVVTDPVSWYGYGPTPDPHITYQPDVVMIDGGPKAIRSASSDGLTWTLDGSAKGVADLQVGKVMFASAKAAGRVVGIQHNGSDVAVTVAPVSLTDVVKDGHLTLNQPLDLGSMLYQPIPDQPGTFVDLKSASSGASSGATPTDGSGTPTDSSTDTPADPATDTPTDTSTDAPTGTPTDTSSTDASSADTGAPADTASPSDTSSGAPSDTSSTDATSADSVDPASVTDAAAGGTRVIKLPPVDLAAAAAASAGQLPPPGPSVKNDPNARSTVSVGNFEVSPYRDGKNIGFTATYSQGLKLSFDFSLDASQAAVHADVPISGGQVASSSQMWLSGIKAVRVKLQAGSANGLADNKKVRIQLPIDLGSELIPIYGIPTTIAMKMTFIVDTGFSAKNSTLTASGSIPLSGNVGFGGSQGSAVSGSPAGGLINSLSGTSVGVNAVVVAANVKASWGLGFAAAMAGPYASLTFSAGFTTGSDIGMLNCKSVTYKVTVGGGVGLSVSSDAIDGFKKALTAAAPNATAWLGKSFGAGVSKDFPTVTALSQTDYFPKVNGCNPSS